MVLTAIDIHTDSAVATGAAVARFTWVRAFGFNRPTGQESAPVSRCAR
jgi:hypothetical protein